eukprot:6184562-Pleurochrysis_carterae.AAC.1
MRRARNGAATMLRGHSVATRALRGPWPRLILVVAAARLQVAARQQQLYALGGPRLRRKHQRRGTVLLLRAAAENGESRITRRGEVRDASCESRGIGR